MRNLDYDERTMIGNLLYEVGDRSLQNILRLVFFTEKSSVEEIIQKQRPEYSPLDIENLKSTK